MSISKTLSRKILPVLFTIAVLLTAAMTAMPAKATEYNYSCQGFYSEPYIFEIGWNVSDKTAETLHSKKLALSDKVSVTVYYDDSLATDMSHKDIIAALKKTISRIRSEHSDLRRPVVLDITDTGNSTPEELTEKYYSDDNIMYYSAVLPFADSKTRQAYLEKSYDDDEAAYFSVSLDVAGSGTVTKQYLDKAFKDGNIALFSISFDHLEDILSDRELDALINTYAKKAYAEDSVDFFAVLAGEMDDDDLEAWHKKAVRDGSAAFANICDDDDDHDRDDDDWDWDWDDDDDRGWKVPEEYASYEVAYKDGKYYYKNEPVRNFLDIQSRTDELFSATVQTNPGGTADIKIVRDKNGNITGVKRLTAEELEEYFG